MGKSSKFLVDYFMDKGIKPLELGASLVVALARTSPVCLNGMDSSIRIKILRENENILQDWKIMETQNE